MSVRLNVLLVQSSAMSGLQSEINAELVVQMMGVPGLDLSIVTSLKRNEASDTDQLLLASFQNDLAILDWRDPSELVQSLAEIGVTGTRAAHRLDPSPAAAPARGRRLYFVDLRRGDPPRLIVEAMRALLNDRQVVAVPLMLPTGMKSNSSAGSVASGNGSPREQAQRATPRSADSQPAATAHATHSASPDAPPPIEQPQRPVGGPAKRPLESDLDALVDGVNDVDW